MKLCLQLFSLEVDGFVSGSSLSTGSFGHLIVGGGNFTSASLAAGGSGGSGNGIFNLLVLICLRQTTYNK